MIIHDISQELLSCEVYPGDTEPLLSPVRRMDRGDTYNLSDISICLHNGTHVDAPFHFIDNGDTVEKIPLFKTVGDCFVTRSFGRFDEKDARDVISRASALMPGSEKRILISGDAIVTPEAARYLLDAGVYLIGVETQSVGGPDATADVHLILLSGAIVLLEGLRLGNIKEGSYFLSAAPISVNGADGAPCRAVLIEF